MTKAEIFEIKPEVPYSSSDINWKNPLARCNKEKIGKKDVPLADKLESIDAYDTIYIGFPIWYYGAPNIIQTFVKDFDWAGKKIYLFATSGGSEMNKTADSNRGLWDQLILILLLNICSFCGIFVSRRTVHTYIRSVSDRFYK